MNKATNSVFEMVKKRHGSRSHFRARASSVQGLLFLSTALSILRKLRPLKLLLIMLNKEEILQKTQQTQAS